MIKKSQSNQDLISKVQTLIEQSELPQNEKIEAIKLIGQYISGQINQGVFMSNRSIATLRTNPSMNALMTEIHNQRQKNLQEQRDNQQRESTTQSQAYHLERVNQERRENGLPEFKTYEEAMSHRDNENKKHKSAVKNLYRFIANGDGDAILASGATYVQVKEAIDNIINRSPSPRGFDDSDHHLEGISEYLRSMYGILDSNEKVYSFFINAIMAYHSRKGNIKSRNEQDRQSKIDEAHARRRENMARQTELSSDRTNLTESRNRERDARMSRIDQAAARNRQRTNSNFSRNNQFFN